MKGRSTLTIGRRKVAVSNLEKVLYPGGKFTKAQVIEYYMRIAPFMLPHLKDRPVTLKRYPNGVHGEFFYEKDAPSFTPDWVKTFPVSRRDTSIPPIQYILINDAATLAWVANTASLELHPFLHRAPAIGQPDFVAFDLDPGDGADILTCAEVGFLLKEVLKKLELECFPKVSGSKGLQLYVPLNTPVGYDTTQPFARALAEVMSRQHPKLVVHEMAKALRRGKVFIDWSQNTDHKTTVAVYSLRAKRDVPFVSLPVTWDELEDALKARHADTLFWSAEEALARVVKLGDLFAPVLKLKQFLPPNVLGLAPAQPLKPAPRTLSRYDAKRNFDRTSEPAPAPLRRSAQGSRRRFVVQKHAASHLHYDFRLEMHDVLKSWAVPKGVPLKDGEMASAFQTEDHPLDYLDFEGIIPQGQYGGGTVMVWDIGTYEILEGNYWKGSIAFHLSGRKLHGAWTLQRQKGEASGEKTKWLLTKTGGAARRIPAGKRDTSALTDRTLEQITKARGAVWQSNRNQNQVSPPEPEEPKVRRPAPRRTETNLPAFVPPMKASLTTALPKGPEWIYEVKWDGYRVEASKNGEQVSLRSLKSKNLNLDFPDVVNAVRSLPAERALLDGEVVAIDTAGKPSFQVLQNRKSRGTEWHIVYYAFDLLHLDGQDLANEELRHRKQKLQALVADSPVRYSAELQGSPEDIVRVVRAAGLEGVVAKRADSKYRAGARVETWLKLKLDKSQEFVIGGLNPDVRSFQSLLVGVYDEHRLVFAGKVRQGFTPALRAKLMKSLQPLITSSCPFANLPTSRKSHFGEGVTAEDMEKLVWVHPRLVCQCAFTEWTNYGLLRHATFLGLRDDKSPKTSATGLPGRNSSHSFRQP